MGYFPFFIDIKGRRCVIIGGGKVALRKAEKLLPFEPVITVVAESVCAGIETLEGVEVLRRKFDDSDLDGAFMAISATDDSALNHHVYELCTQRGILVNSVDDLENCGFIFPALVHKNNITVGAATAGTSPVFARYIRMKNEELLDDRTLGSAALLGRVRPLVKERISTESGRGKAMKLLLERCLSGEELPADDEINKLLEAVENNENSYRNT